MNEKEFEAGHGKVLEDLGQARGECPAPDELMDWVEGALDGGRAGAVGQHVTLCSHCADLAERAKGPDPQVDDVAWQRAALRLDGRAAAWKTSRPRLRPGWLATAAVAVVALAVTLVYLPDERTLSPSDVATTRSTEITLIEPLGPVRSVEAFRWQGIPAPVRYRVEVKAAGDSPESAQPLWSEITPDTRVRADGELLAALETQPALQWRVVVLDEEGYELGHSEWVAFELE